MRAEKEFLKKAFELELDFLSVYIGEKLFQALSWVFLPLFEKTLSEIIKLV